MWTKHNLQLLLFIPKLTPMLFLPRASTTDTSQHNEYITMNHGHNIARLRSSNHFTIHSKTDFINLGIASWHPRSLHWQPTKILPVNLIHSKSDFINLLGFLGVASWNPRITSRQPKVIPPVIGCYKYFGHYTNRFGFWKT